MKKVTTLTALAGALAMAVSTQVSAETKSMDKMAADNCMEMKDGKCVKMKAAEGKCGEGKCGGNDMKADPKMKAAEGKCGEGKCGGHDKKADPKMKAAEGKCGEGKCGGSK